MSKKLNILFLSAWYPNRYDAMAGLFVRKHAEAVGKYANVCVLYLHLDDKIEETQVVEQEYNEIKEILIYIPMSWNRVFRGINFLKGFFEGYKLVKKYFGDNPDITQVNTLTRNAVLAYWLKITQKVPYFIIEHWTRYMPENFCYNGFIRRKVTEIVALRAKKIMVVSEILQKAMQKQNIIGHYQVLYNVVDDFFYRKTAKSHTKNHTKRVLHISCFLDRQKNISGILKATKELSLQRRDFQLVLIGTGVDFERMKLLAKKLNFPKDMVVFTGEQTPCEVARWLESSDFSVMFSNFETACVTVMESLAAGVPVVATPTGIVPELLDERNGQIVDFNDIADLKGKMNFMIENISNYNSLEISQKATVFSSENIGKEIFNIYNENYNKI